MFAAAGDSGAYDDYDDNPNLLMVDDPASQPFVTAVGGTSFTNASSILGYAGETVWGNSSSHSGGGGGISTYWPLQSWQNALATVANAGSSSMRMVPDVALNANNSYSTAYSIYYAGAWVGFGGTSCGSPLWAAFAAIVNQGIKAADSTKSLGYVNPIIYRLGMSSTGNNYFHDITSGNNLYYNAGRPRAHRHHGLRSGFGIRIHDRG